MCFANEAHAIISHLNLTRVGVPGFSMGWTVFLVKARDGTIVNG